MQDGPPDLSEGWAKEERRTVAAVHLNDIRHRNGYFNSRGMSKDRLMEIINEKHLHSIQLMDEAPLSRVANGRCFMLFFRPVDFGSLSSKAISQSLDLTCLQSQKKYLNQKCPAIQRSSKSHFYFTRGLDKTIHCAVGPSGFSELCSKSQHINWEPIMNNTDVPYDSGDTHYPIVVNTERVTTGKGVPFLKLLRGVFLHGSKAFHMLGDSFLDVQTCFANVPGVRTLLCELMEHASTNERRKCLQLHWGKTSNEGGAWKKSSRASRCSIGDMSIVESYTPGLRRWLVLMLVMETYVFRTSSVCPSDPDESRFIWAFCSARYWECRQSMYDYMNGKPVPPHMVLADSSTLCLGRQVYAPHMDKLNDCVPGQDGVSLFSSFFDLKKETEVTPEIIESLRGKGSDPKHFCVACIAYTRKAVGNQAMKNQMDVAYDEPAIRSLIDRLCPDIPAELKDTEWIEECLVNKEEMRRFHGSFKLGETRDWVGFSIKRNEGWSRDFSYCRLFFMVYLLLSSITTWIWLLEISSVFYSSSSTISTANLCVSLSYGV